MMSKSPYKRISRKRRLRPPAGTRIETPLLCQGRSQTAQKMVEKRWGWATPSKQTLGEKAIDHQHQQYQADAEQGEAEQVGDPVPGLGGRRHQVFLQLA